MAQRHIEEGEQSEEWMARRNHPKQDEVQSEPGGANGEKAERARSSRTERCENNRSLCFCLSLKAVKAVQARLAVKFCRDADFSSARSIVHRACNTALGYYKPQCLL
jgi:hypothetical protein